MPRANARRERTLTIWQQNKRKTEKGKQHFGEDDKFREEERLRIADARKAKAKSDAKHRSRDDKLQEKKLQEETKAAQAKENRVPQLPQKLPMKEVTCCP